VIGQYKPTGGSQKSGKKRTLNDPLTWVIKSSLDGKKTDATHSSIFGQVKGTLVLVCQLALATTALA